MCAAVFSIFSLRAFHFLVVWLILLLCKLWLVDDRILVTFSVLMWKVMETVNVLGPRKLLKHSYGRSSRFGHADGT